VSLVVRYPRSFRCTSSILHLRVVILRSCPTYRLVARNRSILSGVLEIAKAITTDASISPCTCDCNLARTHARAIWHAAGGSGSTNFTGTNALETRTVVRTLELQKTVAPSRDVSLQCRSWVYRLRITCCVRMRDLGRQHSTLLRTMRDLNSQCHTNDGVM